ncbi:MAG TPA: hypothetical protein VMZ49_05835 [Patescibacteria group bacterium]|nr:hypothetical protein [Patescibacteria group bacterium]
MKRIFVGLTVLLIGFVMVAGIFAEAADDYKVIKNAVKSPESSRAGQKGVHWFKILVVDKDGDHEKVKITLPVSLVEIMMNACPEKKFKIDHGCQIDIRKVWNDLKAAGPLALVEVEDHDETVKIWFE